MLSPAYWRVFEPGTYVIVGEKKLIHSRLIGRFEALAARRLIFAKPSGPFSKTYEPTYGEGGVIAPFVAMTSNAAQLKMQLRSILNDSKKEN